VSPAPAENRVVLRLKSDAWIQVKERQGQVLLNRVMRAGDTWTVPKGTQLVLSTGNAGGTELLLDGQAMPALGAPGSVRRDVMLDPDALKAASTARPPPQ
jgi:cytoskeleton protein RodZ